MLQPSTPAAAVASDSSAGSGPAPGLDADGHMIPQIPGREFHGAVYRSVVFAYIALGAIAYVAFGWDRRTDFLLWFAGVLGTVFIAIPILIATTARHHVPSKRPDFEAFLRSRVETATDQLSALEAWIQILVIPATLVLAALLMGSIYLIER